MADSKVAKHEDDEKFPSTDTGGVRPMTIAGRYVEVRERLLGMTDEERAFRKQWLLDQHLAPHEPVHVPQLEKELMNPIRRFYRLPLDKLFQPLLPVIGEPTIYIRYFTGKFFLAAFSLMSIHYYFKYQGNDWTKKGGWRVTMSRPAYYAGEPEYGNLPVLKPSDYADRGFKDCPI